MSGRIWQTSETKMTNGGSEGFVNDADETAFGHHVIAIVAMISLLAYDERGSMSRRVDAANRSAIN